MLRRNAQLFSGALQQERHCTFLEEPRELGVVDLRSDGMECLARDSWLGVILEKRQGGWTQVSLHPSGGLLSSRAEARDDEFVATIVLLRKALETEIRNMNALSYRRQRATHFQRFSANQPARRLAVTTLLLGTSGHTCVQERMRDPGFPDVILDFCLVCS